jgi:hypothetical protein
MKTVLNGLLAIVLAVGWAGVGPITASADDMLGEWVGAGDGHIWATIRRGRAKPEYLVADISVSTGEIGCGGSVTVYGKLGHSAILAESYDPTNPDAPICRIVLTTDGPNSLRITEVEGCAHYHGVACGFSGRLTRPLYERVPSVVTQGPDRQTPVTSTSPTGERFSSNSAAIAGLSGRILGAALVCGIARDRLNRAGELAILRFYERAATSSDASYALDLYMNAMAISAQRQKDGDGEPCSDVRSAFAEMERHFGLR